jgi:predicted CXXCH cytochrome family protein
MKNSATKTMLLVMIAIVSVLMVAQIAKAATIVGTAHDLSSGHADSAFKGGSDSVCIYCHTPHGATAASAPLWSRSTNSTNYTPYSSLTLNATALAAGAVSLACLSCHDGTTAANVNAHVSDSTAKSVMGSKIIGRVGTTNSLAADHPIGFTYDAALVTADGGLKTVADLTTAKIPLFGGKMECASCHNVHDNTTAQPFLRVSNQASALCLKCHIK